MSQRCRACGSAGIVTFCALYGEKHSERLFMAKMRSALFYLRRPAYWAHLQQRAIKPFLPNFDSSAHREKALRWARARAVPLGEALTRMKLIDEPGGGFPALSPQLVQRATRNAKRSGCIMGGAGHIDLIYAAAKLSGATAAIETGVAYGWSSLAFLAAMAEKGGRLVSVDRPYPGAGNEPFVGIAVPGAMRENWHIVREPDRHGLRKAVARFPGGIDIAHYDSDKSYRGRMYAYPILWAALKPGGIFLSDDIQDNMAFADFVDRRRISFTVAAAAGKYVGMAIKPGAREGSPARPAALPARDSGDTSRQNAPARFPAV
jgi:predicted O-methyltransferase YrrM